jgi:hypothetical protein
MKNLTIVLLMLFLVACASQSAIVKNSAHIKPGMSDAELRQVMGSRKIGSSREKTRRGNIALPPSLGLKTIILSLFGFLMAL